jgi:hypothetical protein
MNSLLMLEMGRQTDGAIWKKQNSDIFSVSSAYYTPSKMDQK